MTTRMWLWVEIIATSEINKNYIISIYEFAASCTSLVRSRSYHVIATKCNFIMAYVVGGDGPGGLQQPSLLPPNVHHCLQCSMRKLGHPRLLEQILHTPANGVCYTRVWAGGVPRMQRTNWKFMRFPCFSAGGWEWYENSVMCSDNDDDHDRDISRSFSTKSSYHHSPLRYSTQRDLGQHGITSFSCNMCYGRNIDCIFIFG